MGEKGRILLRHARLRGGRRGGRGGGWLLRHGDAWWGFGKDLWMEIGYCLKGFDDSGKNERKNRAVDN